MKMKVLLLSLVSSMIIGSALAQVENDDMYFNSKDRAKLQSQRKSDEMFALASAKKARKETEALNNPTDSYSARNVNPEFTSRSKSRMASEDEENYFMDNYKYNTYSGYNNFNNNFRNWYSNPWYRASFYSPFINTWNSPYYGYYDSFNSPWYDPAWSYNGWSSSFSYYYGNTWNYGWGGNYNYYNRPYCPSSYYYNSYSSYYGGYSPYYGSNWYWNNYRNPGTVVIINNGNDNGRHTSYGKRPTRGSTVVGNTDNRSRSTIYDNGSVDSGNSGGRISTSGRTEYYNKTWKNSSTNNSSSYDSRSTSQQNRSGSWSSPSNSNYSNNSTYSPSRSSSNSSFNSGSSNNNSSRSSGSSSSGGSNGRSRGRD
jgi:hypothetical protein